MSEPHPLMSPIKNQNKIMSSSLFPSPRLFMGIPPKIFSENDSSMSPTSILDSKVMPFICNSSISNSTQKKLPSLGLAEALDDDQHNLFNSPKKDRRMVLFGSQLKIQIPSMEFGVKNKETQLALLSPVRRYIVSPNETKTDRSEEYTCVISHGPNPRTTHIFDDCVINGDLGGLKLDELLTSCHACKKNHGQGTENAIY
ncbi:FCS-Like Zinc finger 8-like [Carex rostrata]